MSPPPPRETSSKTFVFQVWSAGVQRDDGELVGWDGVGSQRL